MAGYIINLNSNSALELYIKNGVYSTLLSPPNGYWRIHHEATFADYATMKPGDNIYFFIDRKIYGIGELVNINGDCKFLNYPDANKPLLPPYSELEKKLLWNEGQGSINQRWICVFKPSPYFFKEGIDMDDVLASNPPVFRMLRAFWKVSFIKVDDDENQALIDIFLRRNKNILTNPKSHECFFSDYINHHSLLSKKITPDYLFNCNDILKSCADGDRLSHEMALEAGILFQLSQKEPNTIKIFGEWDYLSHQVIASPFKPIDYMDKMDIFGYSYIKGFKNTKSEYIVIENKKDIARLEDIEQLMKYVDWIRDEYAFGDYSMINAFLVAYDFSNDAIQNLTNIIQRNYLKGRRPIQSKTWTGLKLIKYKYDIRSSNIKFEIFV
ncbi:hypothetical protein SAMN02745885_01719 [Carboxydocella sporoproducens DSM 16521]|uniref:Uncharacterized protein n=2 Tax=Carboxydocella TaxID=178898 RepID=A0A1T4QLA4_9FIRM|nr:MULTISPECIES: hypothetical protein [Carboxydocella]AVX19227.1 hypothetical protein CFE_0010 [Carboxydocella thermautotrophica]AVX29640.1 hypothetical protein CTH_0011 [Carboxydocella thermautotrophica]GAW29001.1 hypothetical protein ULO1_15710 [Carboxydocella sp. ULO1]SKA04563.1 hypothetical protein SAMN02745885_01719 [Carboxydocella sporoproducens DSM 16521]